MRMGDMFENLSFTKKGSEIIAKAQTLAKELETKIERKKKEIGVICQEHKITVENLFSNLDAFSGATNSLVMPSAEMQKLKKLSVDVDEHKKEWERLRLVIENLDPKREFDLSFEELGYFKF